MPCLAARGGSREPAADTAFAERMYQPVPARVLATIGRIFGADHVNAWAGGAAPT